MTQAEIFPEEIFRTPIIKKGKNPEGEDTQRQQWYFSENPLRQRLTKIEAQKSPALQQALNTNLTADFIQTLHHKATQDPPENINIEIKGETRSGKSTGGITLGVLISKWWGHEFTVENILPNQSELLYRLKDAKYGETFLVDEQTPETYGEGIVRESEQLGSNLNICAKQCNNLIFIYPPSFTSRMSPFGLEAMSKDPINKYVKFFYYDLLRKEFGGSQIPRGYILLPKLVDAKYKKQPKEKWSDKRRLNFINKHYDYDSLLEELYETKKDSWIELVRNMDASVREQKKQTLAEQLSEDDTFIRLKSISQKEAYVKLKINKGEITELTRSEINSIVNMAIVILETQNESTS